MRPARICHSGLIAAPSVCATPMMTPPASVPHSRPAADDHRLKGVDRPGRADGRVEIGARAEIERGDGDHHHGDAVWPWRRCGRA